MGDVHTSALMHFSSPVRLSPARRMVPTHGALTPCLGLIITSSLLLLPAGSQAHTMLMGQLQTFTHLGYLGNYLHLSLKKKKKLKLEPNPLRHVEPPTFNLRKFILKKLFSHSDLKCYGLQPRSHGNFYLVSSPDQTSLW